VLSVLALAGCQFIPQNGGQFMDAPAGDSKLIDAHQFHDAPKDGAEGLGLVQQVTNTDQTANSITASFPSPPTPGHVIILFGGDTSGSGMTPSGVGAPWTFVTGSWTDADLEVWYTVAVAGMGNNVTFTYDHTATAPIFLNVSEWAGLDAASPVDAFANKAGGGASPPTARAGPIATNGSDVIFLAVAAEGSAFDQVQGETPLNPVVIPGSALLNEEVLGAWFEIESQALGSANPGIDAPGQWDGAVVAFKIQ
jgi:hypothetical protein